MSAIKFTRITVNPNQMGGVPCIRGLRIPIAAIVSMIADDISHNEILKLYPDLEREDIREALEYAGEQDDDSVSKALKKIYARHGETLRRLAES